MIVVKTLGAMPVGAFQPLGQGGLPNAEVQPGITLRQHFAGLAMQGLLASCTKGLVSTFAEETAELAVTAADALLTELAKEPQS